MGGDLSNVYLLASVACVGFVLICREVLGNLNTIKRLFASHLRKIYNMSLTDVIL
jgi:hypothetical protein